MSSRPSKALLLYLITAFLVFSWVSGFCAQKELTEIQKQARLYRDQGWQLQKEGNLEKAFSYYQKAILLDQKYAVPYNDAGIILEAIGEFEQAKKMYLKAIEVDSDYPSSYSNLAILYEREDDYANAILCWVKRATLGGLGDPWAEAARKRLEDIARAYPESYKQIGNQYKKNPQ